jgi:hypothetical protein
VNQESVGYQRGLFLPEGGVSSLDKLARQVEAENILFEFVKRMAEQNQDLGPNRTASNYGPAVIARQPKEFRKPEQRLIDTNRIHIRLEGPPTKQRKDLTPGATPSVLK